MGNTSDNKVQLSAGMKRVIEKMRQGGILTKELAGEIWFLETFDQKPERLNWNTCYFMRRRNLIEFAESVQELWGIKHVYRLTELGKSIRLNK